MSVTTKLGVDVSGFTQGINAARASLKTMDAALKQNEAQLRATGDKEAYLQQKTELLSTKMQIQEKVIKETEKALKKMTDAGVKPADAEFQKMQQRLLDAQTGLMNTTTELNTLTAGEQAAAAGADKLGQSMSSIGQKMSLQQVQSAIGSITSGLEAGAKKAAELGRELWDSIMESARRADDTATMAQMYGIDLQKFKQMQALVGGGLDTTVDAILTAQSKMKKGVGQGTDAVMEQLRALGLLQTMQGKYGIIEIIPKDADKLFWDAGQAILAMGDAYEQEAAAQALFGRSWKELIPLFSTYKSLDEYNKALEETSVSSEKATENAATLSDRIGAVETTITQLKEEFIGAIAPALSGAAEALNGVLSSLLEYLQTPEGKQALEDMGKAVEGLFSNLSSIDPEQVVEGFTGVFNSVVSGLEWLTNNSGTVIEALKAIVIGWAGLKLTGGALQIANMISGLTGLGGGSAAAAGASFGGSWAAAFAKAALKAAPWLAGLAIITHVEGTADDDLDTLVDEKTGELTTAGRDAQGGYDPNGWKIVIPGTENMSWDDLLREDKASVDVTQKQFDAIQKFWDVYRNRDNEQDPDAWMAAFTEFEAAFEGQDDLFDKVNEIMDHFSQTRDESVWPEDLPEDFFKTTVTPELPDDAQTILQSALDQMSLHAGVQFNPQIPGYEGEGKANGLPFVPYDGYPAILHKGERVVPAREINNSRSFSSNLYVESMIMNNGTDAAGLAAAIAAANQRTMSGFGS